MSLATLISESVTSSAYSSPKMRLAMAVFSAPSCSSYVASRRNKRPSVLGSAFCLAGS
ncbi:MAG: DUF3678 domain-containing protein [Prevotella sp.]|nr:MAG: DUF3678 domain-containing protein [Prevotella sp.]